MSTIYTQLDTLCNEEIMDRGTEEAAPGWSGVTGLRGGSSGLQLRGGGGLAGAGAGQAAPQLHQAAGGGERAAVVRHQLRQRGEARQQRGHARLAVQAPAAALQTHADAGGAPRHLAALEGDGVGVAAGAGLGAPHQEGAGRRRGEQLPAGAPADGAVVVLAAGQRRGRLLQRRGVQLLVTRGGQLVLAGGGGGEDGVSGVCEAAQQLHLLHLVLQHLQLQLEHALLHGEVLQAAGGDLVVGLDDAHVAGVSVAGIRRRDQLMSRVSALRAAPRRPGGAVASVPAVSTQHNTGSSSR